MIELDDQTRAELKADILHTLRMDHGHTTVNDMQKCQTCIRRADLITHQVERTLGEPSGYDEADAAADEYVEGMKRKLEKIQAELQSADSSTMKHEYFRHLVTIAAILRGEA